MNSVTYVCGFWIVKNISPFFFQWHFIQCVFSTEKKKTIFSYFLLFAALLRKMLVTWKKLYRCVIIHVSWTNTRRVPCFKISPSSILLFQSSMFTRQGFCRLNFNSWCKSWARELCEKICDFQKKSATCFADGHLKISKDSREVWSFVSFLALMY